MFFLGWKFWIFFSQCEEVKWVYFLLISARLFKCCHKNRRFTCFFYFTGCVGAAAVQLTQLFINFPSLKISVSYVKGISCRVFHFNFSFSLFSLSKFKLTVMLHTESEGVTEHGAKEWKIFAVVKLKCLINQNQVTNALTNENLTNFYLSQLVFWSNLRL